MEFEWEYTRTWRTHYINDGEMYGGGKTKAWRLWEIMSSAPYGQYQAKHGYDLFYKSKFVKHGKTVKELKVYVIDETKKGLKDG